MVPEGSDKLSKNDELREYELSGLTVKSLSRNKMILRKYGLKPYQGGQRPGRL